MSFCELARLSAGVGLRFPLLWKDLDHFNDRGSEFPLYFTQHSNSLLLNESGCMNTDVCQALGECPSSV